MSELNQDAPEGSREWREQYERTVLIRSEKAIHSPCRSELTSNIDAMLEAYATHVCAEREKEIADLRAVAAYRLQIFNAEVKIAKLAGLRAETAEAELSAARADAYNLKSHAHSICNENLTEALAAAIEATQLADAAQEEIRTLKALLNSK